MLKYVTLAFIALSTAALATELPPGTPMSSAPAPIAKDGCPTGMLCITPEQLQTFVNQQVEAAKLNEQSQKPEIKDVMSQYQKIMAERNPTPPVAPKSPMPLNPEVPKK